jgi:hypothetical protein
MFKIILNLLIVYFFAALTSPVLAGSDTKGSYAQDIEVRRLRVTSFSEADSTRMKVLQALHVAQAPLHSKQDKATQTEIEAYVAAVKRVEAFKNWLVDDDSCSVSLKREAMTPYNLATYSKAAWGIHDAHLKLEPPFTRTDIGVAVKVMNDARELMKLPVTIGNSSLPDRVR